MELLLSFLPVVANQYLKVASDIHEKHILNKNIKPGHEWEQNPFCKNRMSQY